MSSSSSSSSSDRRRRGNKKKTFAADITIFFYNIVNKLNNLLFYLSRLPEIHDATVIDGCDGYHLFSFVARNIIYEACASEL